MVDWLFVAAWIVWMTWVAVTTVRWQPLGITPWILGSALVLVHSYLIRRRITRLQDEIARRGLDDADTRQARAAFEQQRQRLIGSLKPLAGGAFIVFVFVVVVTAFLANITMPRRLPPYVDASWPDGLSAICRVSSLYLFASSFAIFEAPHALKDFMAADWLWRWPSDTVDDPPTTLNLRPGEEESERKTP